MLWFDEANYILAISCARSGRDLEEGVPRGASASVEAATHAGMVLAMMHSSTKVMRR